MIIRGKVRAMTKKNKTESSGCASCCNIDAVVSVDARGQIVLPKEIRQGAGIEAGDKLAVISWKSGDQVCCISLVKAGAFAETIKGILGPMMSEISGT